MHEILSQGISELQEVRDESYKNAYVFYWSNFESQKGISYTPWDKTLCNTSFEGPN